MFKDYDLIPGYSWAIPVENINLQVDHFVQPYKVFSSNIDRLISLGSSFAAASARSAIYHHSLANARVSLIRQNPYADETTAAHHQVLSALHEKHRQKLYADLKPDIVDGEEFPSRSLVRLVDSTYDQIQSIASTDEQFADGIYALLVSQIVSAWTAFEVLAGDCWEASLNTHHPDLVELKGPCERRSRHAKDFENDRALSPAGTLGTLWKTKFNFSSLPQIQDIYSRAFCIDSSSILSALKGDGLKVLSATRNVVVHQANFVDKKYLDSVGHISFALKAGGSGKLIVNGSILTKLLTVAMMDIRLFIEALDNWLVKNS